MAPKKSKKQTVPVVSPEALKKAQEILADEAEKKRQRSSMTYQMQQDGEYCKYDMLGRPAKNKFLEEYVAKLIEEGKVKVKSTTVQSLEIDKTSEQEWEWLGKQAMINRFGEEKANNKIGSGKLLHQPDPDTGLDGEWDREYKVAKKIQKNIEADRYTMNINTDEDLEPGTRLAERMEAFTDVKSCVAGNSTSGSGSSSVTGSGTGSSVAACDGKNVDIKLEDGPKNTNTKTMDALRKDTRKVFLSCSETITIMKTYFKDTESGRYTQELNNDLKKLIPKFTKIFKKLEQACISNISDEGTLLALALEIDSAYTEFNAAEGWYYRLVPDAENRFGKKRKRSS